METSEVALHVLVGLAQLQILIHKIGHISVKLTENAQTFEQLYCVLNALLSDKTLEDSLPKDLFEDLRKEIGYFHAALSSALSHTNQIRDVATIEETNWPFSTKLKTLCLLYPIAGEKAHVSTLNFPSVLCWELIQLIEGVRNQYFTGLF